LRDVRAYLLLQGEDAWPIVRRALQDGFQRLAEFPESGRVHPEWAGGRYRFLPVYSYEVMYRIEKGSVKIIRVIHGARDLPSILRGL
jgi:toxin ParE1/3/4